MTNSCTRNSTINCNFLLVKLKRSNAEYNFFDKKCTKVCYADCEGILVCTSSANFIVAGLYHITLFYTRGTKGYFEQKLLILLR